MLFSITTLREKGKRVECPVVIHSDACIHSEYKGHHLMLSVSSYCGGPSLKIRELFDPKIIKFEQDVIHILGFEKFDGGSYVQEWRLEAPSPVKLFGHGDSLNLIASNQN